MSLYYFDSVIMFHYTLWWDKVPEYKWRMKTKRTIDTMFSSTPTIILFLPGCLNKNLSFRFVESERNRDKKIRSPQER